MSKIFGLFVSFLIPMANLSAAPDSREVRIGVISGLTGMAAKWGKFQNMGIELAREEYERAGWKIKLLYEDSKTNGTQAITAFDKLVDFGKVDALLADDFGFVTAPLLPKVDQRKKFFITVGMPHDSYCPKTAGYVFSMTSQFSKSKLAFARFFDLHPEVKKIALIAFDDPEWGTTYLRIWKELAAERGIEVVEVFLSSEPTPDFKLFWPKALAKKPDAVFVAHQPEAFFKTRDQFKYSGLVVAANNVLELLVDSQEGRPELEGAYIVDPEISAEFQEKFYNRYKLNPILEAYAGYEAMMAAMKAFEVDAQQPHLGLKKVRYDGVAGLVDFTGKSCAGNQARWGLYRFQDGRQVRQ